MNTHAVSTSGQEVQSRAMQKGPSVLVLLEMWSSPVSIRLLHGMQSALIRYPGHALSQLLECKTCFLGVARRLCQHNTAEVMI